MARSSLRKALQTPLGRKAYGLVQPAIHFARSRRNPGLPLDQQTTTVHFGQQPVQFRHRRWNASDAMCIRQCFGEAQYELPAGPQHDFIERCYQGIVDSGRTPLIVDCGANIGVSVRWFSLRYPRARILAVEPAPDNCEFLRINTEGVPVTIRQCGIAAVDGTAYLINLQDGEPMAYQITGEPTDEPVELLSLGTLLATGAGDAVPFLLKVDIEGSEKALFSGDTEPMQRFPVIIVEPHDWMCPGEATFAPFLRFHVNTGREFAMVSENVLSLDMRQSGHEGS